MVGSRAGRSKEAASEMMQEAGKTWWEEPETGLTREDDDVCRTSDGSAGVLECPC